MTRMTAKQLDAARHYYRKFRAHEGEAFYRPAESAWNSARSHVFFRERLGEEVRLHQKRSRAAKAAWKRRKAAA